MKIFLSVIFFLNSTFQKSFSQTDSSLPITVDIKVVKEYEKKWPKDYFKETIRRNQYVVTIDSMRIKFYDIQVLITNHSSDSITIWLKNCSWLDNFLINNSYIRHEVQQCDNNSELPIHFGPGESKFYTETFRKDMFFDYHKSGIPYGPQVKDTKLGLIIVNDIFTGHFVNGLSYYTAMADKSVWKIIWSNALHLLTEKEASGEPIEIGVYKDNSQH